MASLVTCFLSLTLLLDLVAELQGLEQLQISYAAKTTPELGKELKLKCKALLSTSQGCSWLFQKDGPGVKPTFILYHSTARIKVNDKLDENQFSGNKNDQEYTLTLKKFGEENQGYYFCSVTGNSVVYFSPLLPVFLPGKPTTPVPRPRTPVPTVGTSRSPRPETCRPGSGASGDLMEGELYSALKEEEASESVSSTNFSGEMHFYELVEDTKDGIWLVQVIANDRSPLVGKIHWEKMVKKVSRFGIRTGTFNCSSDPRAPAAVAVAAPEHFRLVGVHYRPAESDFEFCHDIQREEEKVKRSVKDAAKKGQKDVCVVLAKEMIRSRKAVSKLYASKAHMNSVLMGMKNQLAVLRVAGSLQKSTEVMKAMQSLVKIPEIQATMRELSKEMMKAGIIEEMLEDTFESMDDQEEMEEAAEMEIDRILFEITAGALGKAPSKVTEALPEPEPSGAMAASEEGDDEEDEEDLEAMQSRLATLRS
ncbi:Charged multivesicular body protein 3 [Microtus ochrogaster]|uniref:Charged multivesicular body protein 3 n=1 Tax=Microtus ochrogaster TaxID=79684 RepID=A0A8J6KYJ6_MICOH|nr:Charged multivesicular body protein 3 [Microtus ochrogaster]